MNWDWDKLVKFQNTLIKHQDNKIQNEDSQLCKEIEKKSDVFCAEARTCVIAGKKLFFYIILF